ncbi:MAG: CsgG/HfaB family protein [Pseudomonadota bacterium]|nr:CsgG/HfaB family protein [Pseudomonadota bacterium]
MNWLRNTKSLFTMLVVSLALAGCAAMESYTEPTAKTVETVEGLPPYNGPKARIAVARFNVSAANQANQEIGDGLRDMLVTALVESNRFRVVERQDLDAVMQEQQLSSSGAVSQETRVQTGQISGADLLVAASVTEFEGKAGGARGGIGGWGGGVLGAVGAGMNRAHLAIDIRIIDSRTTDILSAKKVEGEARDASIGSLLGGFVGGAAMGGGLQMYANTPMEKAVRICIGEAVKYLAEATPQDQFKY